LCSEKNVCKNLGDTLFCFTGLFRFSFASPQVVEKGRGEDTSFGKGLAVPLRPCLTPKLKGSVEVMSLVDE
jgi:hypothetical protein